MGNSRFEKWLWVQTVTELFYCHGDNGIFTSDEYRNDCGDKGRTQSFSGVVSQHHNAQAERAI